MDAQFIQRVEGDIARINGVAGASVEHEGGAITAVHVEAVGRPEKQIVRDVVSLLRTRHRVELDYRKVSVVTLSAPPLETTGNHRGATPPLVATPTPATPAEPIAVPVAIPTPSELEPADRVSVCSVTVVDEGPECRVSVVLGCGGREILATHNGYGLGLASARLAAMSAAKALERFLHARYRIEVGEVRLVPIGARQAVMVSLSLAKDRDEICLLGSSWALEDIRRSAVHATLDAVNRQFGRLEQRPCADYEVGPTPSQ